MTLRGLDMDQALPADADDGLREEGFAPAALERSGKDASTR